MDIQELDRTRIEEIYETHMKNDFPADELKPLSAIFRMLEQGIYKSYGLYEGDTLQAYAYFVIPGGGNFKMIDYYAVCEGGRGTGIGSSFIRELAGLEGEHGIIVEVEEPDTAENYEERLLRERRIQFYYRNGFRDTLIGSRLFGVTYRVLILEKGMPLSRQDVKDGMLNIYRKMFDSPYYETKIALWER